MPMNVTACYFSPTDTTRKTTEAIARGINPDFTAVNLTLPAARGEKIDLGPEDLLVFGAPVYGGLIPLAAEEAIKNITGRCTPVVLAAVYGNRAYDDALLQMRDLFAAQGFIAVAAGGFLGEHSFGNVIAAGRPDEEDLAKAKAFGEEVSSMLCSGNMGDYALKVPGAYPYRARGPAGGFVHLVGEECIRCLTCVKVCPTAAIDFSDPGEKDLEKCIKCQACAKKCPKQCRVVPDEAIEKTVARLQEMCGPGRKEPALFFGK